MASRLRKTGVAGAITAVGMMTIGLVGQWEGLSLYAYPDVIGIYTACWGETRGIKPGMKFTREQCDRMFIDRLTEFEGEVRKCLTAPDSIPDKPYVAFVSLAYNIGSRAFCNSSIARKANAGDMRGACDAILLYNRAGGKVVKGLVNRRNAERELCLKGLG